MQRASVLTGAERNAFVLYAVPILPSSASWSSLDSAPLRFASSSSHDVTSADDHVASTGYKVNSTTTTLRFRLAADSFYEWIAEGGGGGDVIRRLMGKSPAMKFWERWLESNWTKLPNSTSNDDYDALLAQLDADDSSSTVPETVTVTDLRREDTNDSWMYLTKTLVQLLSSSLVAFIVNRYVDEVRQRIRGFFSDEMLYVNLRFRPTYLIIYLRITLHETDAVMTSLSITGHLAADQRENIAIHLSRLQSVYHICIVSVILNAYSRPYVPVAIIPA